jgi:plasmid stabilization system protein ParE
MSYRISLRADADLDEIWTYIAQDDPQAADQMEQALHEAMEQLARMPTLGHRRPDASDRYRFWRVGAYLIGYRVEKKVVHVVRVLHGSRDIRRFLG